VRWKLIVRMDGSRRIVFLWIEVGGPVVARPRRLGFGTALIQRIAQAQNVAVRIDYSAVSDVSFRRRWNTARDKNVQKA
jgi:two-component sensor histidine kinase